MNQAQFMAQYQEDHGAKFNEKLFIRDENEVIKYLKQIVLACERNRSYLIKVVGFKVVENLDEIKQTMIEYEREKFEQKNRNSKVKKVFDESRFNYIDLKESIVKLLVIRYYVSINNECEYFTVIIKVPRVVDKYYMKIFGKYYLAINQIIDASTYNNSTKNPNSKNKKKQNISFRTIFMKTMMYRSFYAMKTTKKEPIKITYCHSSMYLLDLDSLKVCHSSI